MFHLTKALRRLGCQTQKPSTLVEPPQPLSGASDPQIKLVAITQDSREREALREISSVCGWGVFLADSSSSAVSLLEAKRIPLVVCDRDLPCEDWRTILTRIAFLPHPVCLLLASSVLDERLWMEVLAHHGYDVIPKPLRLEQVARAVNFAWSWCEM